MKTLFAVFVTCLVLCLGIAVVFTPAEQPQAVNTTGGEQVVAVCLDPSLEVFVPAWKTEVGRRFPHSFFILAHGGDLVEGEWVVKGDRFDHLESVDDVVRHYQAVYPDRVCVVLSCNPGHLHLKEHGVYHAMDSVWCEPDRAITAQDFANGRALEKLDRPFEFFPPVTDEPQPSRWQLDSGVAGNIYEFVCD